MAGYVLPVLFRVLILVLFGSSSGCLQIGLGGGTTKKKQEPGERDMGTYAANASETTATCGAGALGAPADYDFAVGFSRTAHSLYWHSGENYAAGTMDDHGNFDFQTQSSTDMRDETQGWMPACSIRRTDVVEGEFDNPRAPTAFVGEMTFSFTPEPGSDCIDLVTGEGAAPDSVPIFATLPCELRYDVEATRTDVEAAST